jgi:hypothetical protein
MISFHPVTGEVRAKGVPAVINAVLHVWLKREFSDMIFISKGLLMHYFWLAVLFQTAKKDFNSGNYFFTVPKGRIWKNTNLSVRYPPHNLSPGQGYCIKLEGY